MAVWCLAAAPLRQKSIALYFSSYEAYMKVCIDRHGLFLSSFKAAHGYDEIQWSS
jgi:hypothetical protein